MHSSLSFLYLFIDCVETCTIPFEVDDPFELETDEAKRSLDLTEESDHENDEFITLLSSRRRKPLKPSNSRGIYAFVTLFLFLFIY